MADVFSIVPYTFTQSPELFRRLWERGHSKRINMALFGDSQETPLGNGNEYIASLSLVFGQKYGSIPNTMLITHSMQGLWHGKSNALNTESPTIASNKILPGVTVKRLDETALGTGRLQILWHLGLQTSTSLTQNLKIENHGYFDISGGVDCEILGITKAVSEEVVYSCRPSSSNTDLSFFGTETHGGTTTMGLQDAVADQVRSQKIRLTDLGGQTYFQMKCLAESVGLDGPEALGMRFWNINQTHGMNVQSFAAGGYSSSSLLGSHANAGPMLKAIDDWDVVMFKYGAIDPILKSEAQYKTNVLANIAAIRGASWMDKPNLLFILASDPYRTGWDGPRQTVYDALSGVHKEIAEADPYVLALNTRRITEDRGFNVGNPNVLTDYLADGVHLNAAGQEMVANMEVYALLGVGQDLRVKRSLRGRAL